MPKQQNTMINYISNQISEAQRVMSAMLADAGLLATVESAAVAKSSGNFYFILIYHLKSDTSGHKCYFLLFAVPNTSPY